jgi:hypothetical protein
MVRSAKGASRTTHDVCAAPGFRPEANFFTCSQPGPMPAMGTGVRRCDEKSGWIRRICLRRADKRRGVGKGPGRSAVPPPRTLHSLAPRAGRGRVRGNANKPLVAFPSRAVRRYRLSVREIEEFRAYLTQENSPLFSRVESVCKNVDLCTVHRALASLNTFWQPPYLAAGGQDACQHCSVPGHAL